MKNAIQIKEKVAGIRWVKIKKRSSPSCIIVEWFHYYLIDQGSLISRAPP